MLKTEGSIKKLRSPLTSGRKVCYSLIRRSGGLLILISILSSLFWGWWAGRDILLGGVVWLLPSWVLARQFFLKCRSPKMLLKAFLYAEVFKLILVSMLFLLIFHYMHPVMPFFLFGLIAAQGTILLMPWTLRSYK